MTADRVGSSFRSSPPGRFELGLTFDDPGVGGLFSVERLGLAVDDLAAFFDDDLGGIRLRAVFASPSYYATHRYNMPF